MALDLPKLSQEVAEGLLYDLRQPLATAGLDELDKEAKAPGSKLMGYAAWRAAFDQLVRDAGITRDGMRGAVAKDGLKPDAISALAPAQIQVLATFGAADNEGGRKNVQSSRASLFLGEFHAHFALPLTRIIHEKALEKAQQKFTAFWQKHTELLSETVNDPKYCTQRQFIEGINRLAQDGSFFYSISTGMAKGKHFTADAAKLQEALNGQGISALAVKQLDSAFIALEGAAASQGDKGLEGKLKAMQQEYFRDVKTPMANLASLNATLQTLEAEQQAHASYRKYT